MNRFKDIVVDQNISASPWFPIVRIGKGSQHVLWSPHDPRECSARMNSATLKRGGLLNTRLFGAVEDYAFKVRHAAAVEIGTFTGWAEGVIEDNGDGSVIRFRFGPFRMLRNIMLFNGVVFCLISITFVVALIYQVVNRPLDEISGTLKAGAILLPFGTLYILGLGQIIRKMSNPDSLIRFLCQLLDAQVVNESASLQETHGSITA